MEGAQAERWLWSGREDSMPRRERQRWQLSVDSKEETKDDWIERGTVLPFIVVTFGGGSGSGLTDATRIPTVSSV